MNHNEIVAERSLCVEFLSKPTCERKQTAKGQSLSSEFRDSIEFAITVGESHDLFPKYWCRSAMLLLVNKAAAVIEPLNRLAYDAPGV